MVFNRVGFSHCAPMWAQQNFDIKNLQNVQKHDADKMIY